MHASAERSAATVASPSAAVAVGGDEDDDHDHGACNRTWQTVGVTGRDPQVRRDAGRDDHWHLRRFGGV